VTSFCSKIKGRVAAAHSRAMNSRDVSGEASWRGCRGDTFDRGKKRKRAQHPLSSLKKNDRQHLRRITRENRKRRPAPIEKKKRIEVKEDVAGKNFHRRPREVSESSGGRLRKESKSTRKQRKLEQTLKEQKLRGKANEEARRFKQRGKEG